MKELGKRKMSGIVAHETGLPYKDVVIYGRYRKYGGKEELKIGAFELIHIIGDGFSTLYEPEFTDEEPRYGAREIELREDK